MNPTDARRLPGSDANTILGSLSTRQHIDPHRPLKDSLAHAQAQTGFCPDAAERAMQWLQLDPEAPIGRLRRSELMQLARSIHRYWGHALSSEPTESHSV